MEAILNFGDKFDIALFEKVVSTLYEGIGTEVLYFANKSNQPINCLTFRGGYFLATKGIKSGYPISGAP